MKQFFCFVVQDRVEEPTVNNEEADRMSLFYAYPTPMLKAVSDATTRFVTEVKLIAFQYNDNLSSVRRWIEIWLFPTEIIWIPPSEGFLLCMLDTS